MLCRDSSGTMIASIRNFWMSARGLFELLGGHVTTYALAVNFEAVRSRQKGDCVRSSEFDQGGGNGGQLWVEDKFSRFSGVHPPTCSQRGDPSDPSYADVPSGLWRTWPKKKEGCACSAWTTGVL